MQKFISFQAARELILTHVSPLGSEPCPLTGLHGRILAEPVFSRVDSPSLDISMKDGFAVKAADLEGAGPENPIILRLAGQIGAGGSSDLALSPGEAIRLTTGAPIPDGADAVLAEEFSRVTPDGLECTNFAEPGRNILNRGADVKREAEVAGVGEQPNPALAGLLALAGFDKVPAYRIPRVAVIGTGDEVVAPGEELTAGKLYASNQVEICGWLTRFLFPFRSALVGDDRKGIRSTIETLLPDVDVILTSGGIWGSERDLMLQVLADLGWQGIFHRVRLGPGKAIGFGLLQGKPIFCLPGGPPSNEMAFLQLALPGLLAMHGAPPYPFPRVHATLTERVRGDGDWTQGVHARLSLEDGKRMVTPVRQKSRFQTMARKNSILLVPTGVEGYGAGELVTVQVLDHLAIASA